MVMSRSGAFLVRHGFGSFDVSSKLADHFISELGYFKSTPTLIQKLDHGDFNSFRIFAITGLE